MKTNILGLLAVGLLAGPMAANAFIRTYDFTVNGRANGPLAGSAVPEPGTLALLGLGLAGLALSRRRKAA